MIIFSSTLYKAEFINVISKLKNRVSNFGK